MGRLTDSPVSRELVYDAARMVWRTRTIGDAPRMVLRQQGDVLELVSGHVVLLSSAALETERSFGHLVVQSAPREGGAWRVLIGGLGFGATVRGVLDVAGPGTRIGVAEKVEAVVRLVRGELADVAGRPLEDARVAVRVEDVSLALGRADGDLDAVLLDVDNGPHWASFRENARLYTAPGLALARRALAPGGMLAVWSGYPADAFLPRLRTAGFAASVVPLLERGRVCARAYVGVKRT